MHTLSIMLTLAGALLLAGLLTDELGRRTPLPRVTLQLLLGAAIGPWLAELAPEIEHTWFPGIAQIALAMVGFLLGERLQVGVLRAHGRIVLCTSVSVVIVTLGLVAVGLFALGVPLALALVIGAIATATAPAATQDTVREVSADGPFSRTLLEIVALDDAWGLIAFSVMLALAVGLCGDGAGTDVLLVGARELGGALLLGAAIGVPAALLSGRIRPGEPTLVEALGIVLLCSGIGLWLDISVLLAAMVLGAVVANLARHHTRPFHAIEQIEWPFMILFFVFAGASLHLAELRAVGWLAGAYVGLRVAGRLLGGWIGARIGAADAPTRRWIGAALMPQAGVALGMALVVQRRYPELGASVLPLVIASTVLFEITGPVLTRFVLVRVGEAAPRGS